MQAAIEAGKKAGSTAAGIAAAKAAEGYIKELTEQGKKVDPAVKKEMMDEAVKAGELVCLIALYCYNWFLMMAVLQAGSSKGAEGAMGVAGEKMEKKDEKKAEPAAVKLAAKIAKEKGSDLGKQEGEEVGHKAGHEAGLAAAKRIFDLRTGNQAKVEAEKVGAQAGEAAGGEEGAIAGAQLARDLAEKAVDQAILERKGWFDKLPKKKQESVKLAGIAAARKAGVLKGTEEGKKAGAEAGKKAGTKTGEIDAEKAEKKVKESGRANSAEKETIIIAEQEAKTASATAGSDAGKAAIETVDKTAIIQVMMKAAKQAMEDRDKGNEVPLFDAESAQHKAAYRKEGMLAGENAGKVQGQQVAIQGAQKYLSAVANRTGDEAKVLPQGCDLSKMRISQIVDLAGTTGKREGALAGKKASEKALEMAIKSYPEDHKFTKDHVKDAVKRSTDAASSLETMKSVEEAGIKVAVEEVKHDVELCSSCPRGKKPDSDECL